MTRSRKFVALALVATLWVATFGFVPRANSASPSSDDGRHACVHLDATANAQAANLCAAGTHSIYVENDGVYLDEDGPEIACCEVSDTVAVPAQSPSMGEHRDRAHVLPSYWDSLAARGPPQR